MKTKLLLCAAALIFGLTRGYGQDAQSLETGSFSIGGKLQLDMYRHKTGNSWEAQPSGYKGINFNYDNSVSTASMPWENIFGQTLFLNVGLRPTENFSGEMSFEAINAYADRYWLPVNYEHRLKADGKNFAFTRADIAYTRNIWELHYYRNIGHYNWSGKGDLFDLFPEQYESDRYLRVSGRPVPEWWQFDISGRPGSLQLIYGPEAIWGFRHGVYANYGFTALGLDNHFIFRDHQILYGTDGERMRDYQLSSAFDLGSNTLQAGILYQPFRLDREYEYVEEVAPGAGLYGTKYLRKTGRTGASDALGGSTRLTVKTLPFLNEAVFQYTYLGLVAGNKQEFNTQLNRKLTRSLLGSIEYTYRKPLLGPMPLVYEGTAGNTGPALFQPRGPESPFWVGWGLSAGWDNREASLLSLILTFDPTPDSWFYLFKPNAVEEWNLNPAENAGLSFALRYTLSRYPTSTDRLIYWDENGDTVWEPPMQTEPWATDGYLGSFSLLSKILVPQWKLLFELGGGESPASGGFAYTASTAKEKPITGYLITGLAAEHGPYIARVRYSQNVWGPEEWHRQFGQSFDKLYQAGLSRRFGEFMDVGIEYVGTREEDNKYLAPELGEYDEFRFVMSLSFGPYVPYFGARPAGTVGVGEMPEVDNTPPQVSLALASDVFTPESQNLVIEPWAADYSGVAKWKIEIADSKGRIVKTLSGDGQPPYSVEWNGRDDIYDMVVPDGIYRVTLSATDESDNTAVSEAVTVTVKNPPKTIIKEVIKEVPKEIQVTETDRGLKVSLTSQVLFDSGKSELKPGAAKVIAELVSLLKEYTQNKISVEGHTDNVGSKAYNQKLSEKRAWSVAQQLINAGITADRINVVGYGFAKPVAPNTTSAGREANRRVEVIILK